jgi:mRNA-degrading endonuclease RelE of RelBE toxin-antitoxin system
MDIGDARLTYKIKNDKSLLLIKQVAKKSMETKLREQATTEIEKNYRSA